jgi:hypothetical protein
MIAVSEENYLTLKKLGSAGDSFNDVVTEVLKQVEKTEENENKLSRTIPGLAARNKSLIDRNTGHELRSLRKLEQ